jgi:pilus assembly protein CpaC
MCGHISRKQYFTAILAAAFAAAWISLFCYASARAAETPEAAPQVIRLTRGKSRVMDLAAEIKRVSLADPEIADILLLSPRQIYLTGKKPGKTNVTLWTNGGVYNVYDLTVSPDVSRLKQTLHRVLPEERNLKVMTAGDTVTLTGTVSSTENLATVVELANIYSPDKVSNLLHVGGVHQVMLEVKVAEMSRSVLERLGIDLSFFLNGNLAFTLLNGLYQLSDEGILANAPRAIENGAINEQLFLDPTQGGPNGIFRVSQSKNTLTGFLDMLKQNGLVKILAEPTLICKSGEEASFLAGGEIPIPVPSDDGVAIEYKQYGVSLEFTPSVISDGRIDLSVHPEVSELDFSNTVRFSGAVIPGLTSRRASTTVELGDGQSFAIAGLLRDQTRENVDKYPVLGDMPILGALFRSSEFRQSKSELVIIVTPHLAKPLDMANQKLPTDDYVAPSEWDFFVMGESGASNAEAGASEASWTPPPASKAAGETGMEGRFGHILPDK